MKYALFLGCTIPARAPSYESAFRKVMKELDVDLVDLDGATCCAPIPIESMDYETSMAIAAYNICLAEELDLDLITICNGCFQLLSKANAALKGKKELRAKINSILSDVGKEYKGTKSVKNFIQVLYGDLGLEKIKKSISKPLKGLKVAVFYGCHILMPSSILRFDDPINPHLLDDLVELIGAGSVPYMDKMRCCGGLLRGIDDELGRKLARDKLFCASQARADCIITVCPFCFVQLDLGQLEVRRLFNEQYNIPIVFYPELLGLAMGMEPKRLGLHTHKISTDSLLKKIG